MAAYLLRRRKLGFGSCQGVKLASKTGIKVRRQDGRVPKDCTLAIRWGNTRPIPDGIPVINPAEAIQRVNDKTGFRKILQDANPDLVPKTFFSTDGMNLRVDADAMPVVVRPQTHHQGRNLHVCRTPQELAAAVRVCGANPYASKLIEKVAEYRVFVVQGRVPCVARKYPNNQNDVAWNVARGGRFENVSFDNWPLKVIRYAIEAYSLSGLDIAGVDVMVDAENNPYILEINSAPSLTSPYRQGCLAKSIDWMVTNGKTKIPLIEERGGWRKFVHPSITEEAILPNA